MTTSIGKMENGQYALRGKPLAELMASTDFVSAAWLAWTGMTPTEAEANVLRACFVACVDHGAEPPSAHVARTVASCGKPLADAVAAGLLTLGPRHGNAAGAASEWLRASLASGRSAEDFAKEAIAGKKRLSGFGHPEYAVDPRAQKLIEISKKNLGTTPHCDFALQISSALTAAKGKPLPLNIDGALGAVVADMGAPTDLADAIFIAARTAGLIAHAREEASSSASYRRG